jgi:hypothetical protein
MDLVYDSGSQIEELHQQYIGKLFNSNGDTDNDTIPQTFDTRSTNKVSKYQLFNKTVYRKQMLEKLLSQNWVTM